MYIESYKKLTVWQKAMELSGEIYKTTRFLPQSETYGLISQMRRCAVSIPSNIAEGYKRQGLGEFLNFLGVANGSAAELDTQILLARDLYPKINFSRCESLLIEVQKMLAVMIKKLKDKRSLNTKRLTLNAKTGFTLVELIVGMGVFLIAITLAVGVFAQALKTQRIINDLMAVNSNTSIALESMAREIRTGYNFSDPQFLTPPLCTTPQFDILTFKNFNGKLVSYKLQAGVLARQECLGSGCAGTEPFLPMTASNVLVNRLCFLKTQTTSNNPWRVSVFLAVGSVNPRLANNVLNLQTTVSSRILPKDLVP